MHTSSFNCSTGPLDVLDTGVTATSSILPSSSLPGRVIGNGADSAAEMCRQERFRERICELTQMCSLTRTRQHIAAHTCVCLRTRPQTHADASVNASAADAAGSKTGYRSSADACGRIQYFWWKRKCLRPHISHLQRRASIATAATISLCGRGRAT